MKRKITLILAPLWQYLIATEEKSALPKTAKPADIDIFVPWLPNLLHDIKMCEQMNPSLTELEITS